jgi:hypothetical protein
MPSLQFHLKKRADATAQLILRRDDGTHTLGAIGPADGYGPVHDLTHYAIEQTLGLSEGFLGLIAAGWEIADFEVKGTARRLPAEAIFAEVAAGELSRQLVMRQVSSLEDFCWALDMVLPSIADGFQRPEITSAQFNAIHAAIDAEWRRWKQLEIGGTLELTFTGATRSTCPAPTADERRLGRLVAQS